MLIDITYFSIQDISNLHEELANKLSLANGPPYERDVYSKAHIKCVSELQEHPSPGMPFILDISWNLRLCLRELLRR